MPFYITFQVLFFPMLVFRRQIFYFLTPKKKTCLEIYALNKNFELDSNQDKQM